MMKTIRRYSLTTLVASLAFLPLLYRLVPNMPWVVELLVAVAIGVVAWLAEHYRRVRPRLKLEEKRTYLFGTVCRSVLAELCEYDQTARLNIMEIDRRFLASLSVFNIIYGRGMEGDPDKNLRLKLTQGVAGQAVAQQALCVANLETAHAPTFGLDADQVEKTKDLTLVLSMPIKRTEKMPDGSFALTDDVIGTVNIDSKRKDAHRFYETTFIYENDSAPVSLLDKQVVRLRQISELCSYIMS